NDPFLAMERKPTCHFPYFGFCEFSNFWRWKFFHWINGEHRNYSRIKK
ncbi:MAG: hypothetical protein ACJA1H_001675, partial [Glaciecola sp.]